MNIYMQRKTTGMPYLLKDKQCYNKLYGPEWVKNASWRATPSLSIVHNYVSAFDPTPCTVICLTDKLNITIIQLTQRSTTD